MEYSNLKKRLFEGITKHDLIGYYEKVAEIMLAHCRKKPVSMERFPDGAGGEIFFQKQVPEYFPAWIATVKVGKEKGEQDLVVIDKKETILYLANQVAVPHLWLSTADDLERPDRVIFDIDPSGGTFDEVKKAAMQRKALSFRLLHKDPLSPIRYERTCEECEEPVPWEDIVKGLEIRKGEYVVFDQDELESIRPEKSRSVEIAAFIDESQVDPIYYDKHYFLAPEGEAKPYFLLKEVIERAGKVAIGRFVMREKEHIALLRPYGKGLMLTTLHYAYEVRDIESVEEIEDAPELSEKEISLAESLVERLAAKEFDISGYKDTFAEELKRLVKLRAEGASGR